MKNKIGYFCISLILVLLTACSQKAMTPTITANNVTDKSGEYSKKVDNFLIIFDASSSLFDDFKGQSKFDIAKNTATRLNKTIPTLDMQSGLRVYGPNLVPWQGYNTLIHGMEKYSTSAMQGALDSVTGASGTSPLSKALGLAAGDLSAVGGNIAIIAITDALVEEGTTLAAANSLKSKFGDRLCIYPILIGDSSSGKAILDKVVEAVGCGFVRDASQINTPEAMADYVTEIFYGKIQDRDGDGVIDSKDKCPNTPIGVAVDGNGCPKDSDGDGVIDATDKCPDTPRGTNVNAEGCPELITETVTIELKIEFDTNKADVKPIYYEQVKRFADFMKQYPDTKAIIGAHTDNTGSEGYNQKLSQKRANNVMKYIIENFKISSQRINGIGYGFSRPIADNDTANGRQRNRRVDAVISKTIDKNK
jgi:OmpA-OmpF porin, OOP family